KAHVRYRARIIRVGRIRKGYRHWTAAVRLTQAELCYRVRVDTYRTRGRIPTTIDTRSDQLNRVDNVIEIICRKRYRRVLRSRTCSVAEAPCKLHVGYRTAGIMG